MPRQSKVLVKGHGRMAKPSDKQLRLEIQQSPRYQAFVRMAMDRAMRGEKVALPDAVRLDNERTDG